MKITHEEVINRIEVILEKASEKEKIVKIVKSKLLYDQDVDEELWNSRLKQELNPRIVSQIIETLDMDEKYKKQLLQAMEEESFRVPIKTDKGDAEIIRNTKEGMINTLNPFKSGEHSYWGKAWVDADLDNKKLFIESYISGLDITIKGLKQSKLYQNNKELFSDELIEALNNDLPIQKVAES